MDRSRSTRPGVGRHHVEDHAPVAAVDHRTPHGARQIEAAVEHDVRYGGEGFLGQLLGRPDEVAGRVVDQNVDSPEPFLEPPHRATHTVHVTHVAGGGDHVATGGRFGLERGAALLEVAGVAADQRQVRSPAGEGPGDLEAKPRPTPGDQGDASGQGRFAFVLSIRRQ